MTKRIVTSEAIPQDTPKGKVMLVAIADDTGIPEFHFTGEWTGKDITLIAGLFSRAYHKHVKTVRASGTYTGTYKGESK